MPLTEPLPEGRFAHPHISTALMKRWGHAHIGGERMSDDDSRLKELLDGKLSADEIANDPVLASLAERIYGADFLDNVGISRGETKRALAEQFSEIDGDDLLIDELPEGDLPLPMPEDMPPVPVNEDLGVATNGRSLMHKLRIFGGLIGLIAVTTNLFYGLGNFLSVCATDVHSTCGESLKLTWIDFFRMDEHIAWSPTGSVGIPDVILALLCIANIVNGLRRRN